MTDPNGQPDGKILSADKIESELCSYLAAQMNVSVPADLDLFASGTISSMFAMQLVVHLESTFGVVIAGRDLKMANFATIEAMVALVLRLLAGAPVAGSGV